MLSPFITRVPIFNPSRDHSNDVTWLFTGQNGVDQVNGVDKINPTSLKVAKGHRDLLRVILYYGG